jgi:hypothetical protein
MGVYKFALIDPRTTTGSRSSQSLAISHDSSLIFYSTEMTIDSELTVAEVFNTLCTSVFSHLFGKHDNSQKLEYVLFSGTTYYNGKDRSYNVCVHTSGGNEFESRKWSEIYKDFSTVFDVTFKIYSAAIPMTTPSTGSFDRDRFKDAEFSAVDIPSISEALSIVQSEISNAALILPKIQNASISLEQMIQKSNFVNECGHHAAVLLKQSAMNLQLAMNKCQDKMTLLKNTLSGKLVFPDNLQTADDISVALHIAVSGPQINWFVAERVLEDFCIL